MSVWHYVQLHYLDNVVAGFIYTIIASGAVYLWKGKDWLEAHRRHIQRTKEIHQYIINQKQRR